jgi:HAD superfamily hydrolase (TIGR01459 family)
MTVPILAGLKDLPPRYKGLIVDLWGVIHDGITPYPGVVEAMTALKDCGRSLVMLSNAPRRAQSLVDLMTDMGIDRHLYLDIITSGEVVFQELLTRRDPWFAGLGRRCLHMGTERDRDLFEGLSLDLVDDLGQAQFLLVTGPDDYEDRVEDFMPLMDAAKARGLPMVCANPDLVVIRSGRPLVCAGALAAYYGDIGGEVCYRGKPDPAIYDVCLARMGISERGRVLGVGDAFATDVAGARAAGIDSLLCTGGIHAEEIGTAYGRRPDADRLEAAVLAREPLRPTFAIGGFLW